MFGDVAIQPLALEGLDHILPEKKERISKLVNNYIFQRLCRGFEIYQELLKENRDNEEQLKNIEKRMAKVGIILTQFTLQDILRAYQVSEQLEKCKAESFSIQLFATQLVEDGTDKKLLHEWTHREGDEVADRPTVYLNEIVSYTWAVENYVTLDIAPANFPSDKILPKIYEGFKKNG